MNVKNVTKHQNYKELYLCPLNHSLVISLGKINHGAFVFVNEEVLQQYLRPHHQRKTFQYYCGLHKA